MNIDKDRRRVVIEHREEYDIWEIVGGIERLWGQAKGGANEWALARGLPIEKDLVRGWVQEYRPIKDGEYVEIRGMGEPDIEVSPWGLHDWRQVDEWENFMEVELDLILYPLGLGPTRKRMICGWVRREQTVRQVYYRGTYDTWEMVEYLRAWLIKRGAKIRED